MGKIAQKICGLEHQQILDTLNQAYAEEWLAYYQYWIGSQIICGPMRVTIQQEFLEHAKEELEHANLISERIIQLGGVPLLNPVEWMQQARCGYETPKDDFCMSLLRQNLDSERCAIMRYQHLCEMSFGKDFETYEISSRILHQELDHEQDWEDYIEDFEKGAVFFGKKEKEKIC